jgi:release factor glutamine methyltransferase
VRSAAEFLNDGGWVLLEHGHDQEKSVRKLLTGAGFESVKTWPDLAGIARATGGKLKSD